MVILLLDLKVKNHEGTLCSFKNAEISLCILRILISLQLSELLEDKGSCPGVADPEEYMAAKAKYYP